MDTPEVSVIMPVYNRPDFLRPAIASVLGQSFAAWELLIADDGSDDPETLAILADQSDPRVRMLRLPHSGSPSVARNAALREARGEFVAFLDSDDVWLPEKLEVQLAALRARPTCGWSYGPVERIDPMGAQVGAAGIQRWWPYEREMVRRLLLIEAIVPMPTVMMRRDLAEAIGGFDEALWFGEDYDLFIRAALRSEVAVVDRPLVQFRVHPENYSRDRLGAHRGWMQLYAKYTLLAPTRGLCRLAHQREAASALTVANLLARSGRGSEARRLVRQYLPVLLAQPRQWRPLARLGINSLL